jgi:methyl-accepting chemotaxis protein
VVLVLTVGMSYLAISNLRKGNERVESLFTLDMQGIMHANRIAVARGLNGLYVRDAMLNVNKPVAVAEDERLSYAELAAIQTEIEAVEKLFYTAEGKEAVSTMRNALPAYDKGVRQIYAHVEAKDLAGAEAGLSEVMTAGKPLFDAMARAIDLKQKAAESRYKENNAAYQTARSLMLTVCFISLALGVILSIVIARGFAVPLGQAVVVLGRVAEGDLTASLDVHTKDELGRMAESLNQAVEKLNSTLKEVADDAANASSASQQLAAAAENIASGAQEQAASLEETSASMEEIAGTVRQSADNANQASQLAASSKDSALQGQEVVSNAVTAMGEINAASAKISDIISTIDEIAFQTNLLAVNAAVEAARAGDEGRGFAVVASEVRSLAQRSAVAAKEIKGLIQDSLRKVEAGSALVNRSGETLHGIVGSVKRVTDIVGEIAAASAEQSTGIEQVNTALTQMDQVTQSNSAQTEELSATAQSLAAQSGHLMEMIGAFTLSKGGRDARDRQEARLQEASPAHAAHASATRPAQPSPMHPAAHASAAPSGPVAQHAGDTSRGVSPKPARRARPSKGPGSQTPAPTATVPPSNGSGGSDSSFVEF